MKFLYGAFFILIASASVAVAQSPLPSVVAPVGYKCTLSGSLESFTGSCKRIPQLALPSRTTYSNVANGNVFTYAANAMAQGGPCSMAGPNSSLCREDLGCRWYSPQGTRGGQPISPRERDAESYCYDGCSRLPISHCGQASGCSVAQVLNPVRIVTYGGDQGSDAPPLMLEKCVRSSTLRR